MREQLPTPVWPWMPVNEPWRIGAKRIGSSIRIVGVGIDRRWQDHRCFLVVAVSGRRRRRRIGVGWRRLPIAVGRWRRLLVGVTLLVAVTLALLRRIVLRRWWWLRLAIPRRRLRIRRRNI